MSNRKGPARWKVHSEQESPGKHIEGRQGPGDPSLVREKIEAKAPLPTCLARSPELII